MRRRVLLVIVIALILMIIPSLVLAHGSPTYVLRETGTLECAPSQTIYMRIWANGHHKHKVNSLTPVVDHNSPGWRVTLVKWSAAPPVGQWYLYNESGFGYDYTGSYGYCGAS